MRFGLTRFRVDIEVTFEGLRESLLEDLDGPMSRLGRAAAQIYLDPPSTLY